MAGWVIAKERSNEVWIGKVTVEWILGKRQVLWRLITTWKSRVTRISADVHLSCRFSVVCLLPQVRLIRRARSKLIYVVIHNLTQPTVQVQIKPATARCSIQQSFHNPVVPDYPNRLLTGNRNHSQISYTTTSLAQVHTHMAITCKCIYTRLAGGTGT